MPENIVDFRQAVMEQLATVIDPELNIDIVSLGLIYNVTVTESAGRHHVAILMTLTTPGCPLAGVLDQMVRTCVLPTHTFDPEQDLSLTITFDPPWVPDMMSLEARMELGLE